MKASEQAGEGHDLHEGAWIYLSVGEARDQTDCGLRESLVEACHSSGWPAISWSRPDAPERDPDHARFFEGMSDAVARADLLVTLVGDGSTIGDAELAFAYRYGRPVVGIRITEEETDPSEVRAMLPGYRRARVIECRNAEDCAEALRLTLSDTEFLTTIYEASREQVSDG
jgi:hypothetical protein